MFVSARTGDGPREVIRRVLFSRCSTGGSKGLDPGSEPSRSRRQPCHSTLSSALSDTSSKLDSPGNSTNSTRSSYKNTFSSYDWCRVRVSQVPFPGLGFVPAEGDRDGVFDAEIAYRDRSWPLAGIAEFAYHSDTKNLISATRNMQFQPQSLHSLAHVLIADTPLACMVMCILRYGNQPQDLHRFAIGHPIP